MTDDCKGFVVVTFATHVLDVVRVDEAAVVVPHCELVVILGFDAVATFVVDVLYSRLVISFHLVMYLVVVAVLSPLGGIEVHVNFVLLVFFPLTELVHLTDQL